MRRHSNRFPVAILADAHSAMGSIEYLSVGSRDAVRQRDNGYLFHKLLINYKAFLPATFDCFHQGQDFTLTLPNGFHLRRDDVALPQAWRTGTFGSKVDVGLLLSTSREDHCAVRVKLPLILKRIALLLVTNLFVLTEVPRAIMALLVILPTAFGISRCYLGNSTVIRMLRF